MASSKEPSRGDAVLTNPYKIEKELITIGLDNGVYVKSNKRVITRDMLPQGIEYPFDFDYDNNVEIIYHRKDWHLRNKIVYTFHNKADKEGYYFQIDTVDEVLDLMRIIVSFMNREKWEDGNSIWTYDEALPGLQRDVINLGLIAAYMRDNPDVYLVFYDSY